MDSNNEKKKSVAMLPKYAIWPHSILQKMTCHVIMDLFEKHYQSAQQLQYMYILSHSREKIWKKLLMLPAFEVN